MSGRERPPAEDPRLSLLLRAADAVAAARRRRALYLGLWVLINAFLGSTFALALDRILYRP